MLLCKLIPKVLQFFKIFHQILFLIISLCSLNTLSDGVVFYLNVGFIVGREEGKLIFMKCLLCAKYIPFTLMSKSVPHGKPLMYILFTFSQMMKLRFRDF